MNEILLQAQGLSRSFGARKIIDGLELSLHRGEILGFLGPNGAGKTTTMRLLTGVLTPDEGEIFIKGQALASERLQLPSPFGYLPEGAPQWGEREVGEFLHFMADMQGLTGDGKQQAIDRYCGLLGLSSVWHQMIANLSKGYRRRVSLAATLLHEPDILILDEPTDGLDPNQKQEVHRLLRELAKSRAILISTHNLEEVNSLCDRVVVIAAGKIVASGDLAQLKALDSSGGGDLAKVFHQLTKGAELALA